MRSIVLIATTLLIVGCTAPISPEGAGSDGTDSAQTYELDYALAKPIFSQYYTCGEHREGELPYIGDALGADCAIQKLEEVDGRTFARAYKGDGNANDDWYGWGKDVLSPCAGEVVKVTTNAVTNEPGLLGEPPATFVVVKREDGVHFLLAHLDDLAVEVGNRVTAGQKLGVVGNNGYGRNPHVHIGAWYGDAPLQVRFDLSAAVE